MEPDTQGDDPYGFDAKLDAKLETLTTHDVLAASDDPDDNLRSMLVDWTEFWARDLGDPEWIVEPIIPRGRSVAIFAPGGTGKSLFTLWMVAHVAAGIDPFDGTETEPRHVLYLDYEMTQDDLAERLTKMGFADRIFDHLHYALLPPLDALDSVEGGVSVRRLAELVDAAVVVIDTFGRAVHGDENDADTVRKWYRYTGLHLKAEGRAFVRVDHAGKDVGKGQRGSSAKNDDVDVVWKMTATEDGYKLHTMKRRTNHVPQDVVLTFKQDKITERLEFGLRDGDTYPEGTMDVVTQMDDQGVPIDTSRDKVRKQFKIRGATDLLGAAIKYRKRRSGTYHFVGDKNVSQPVDNHQVTPQVTSSETTSGHVSGHDDTKSTLTREGSPERSAGVTLDGPLRSPAYLSDTQCPEPQIEGEF